MPQVILLEDAPKEIPVSEYLHARWPAKIKNFNVIQSRILDVYDKDVNCVIAASTASGKTICSELFAAHEARVRGGKIIYLAPLKALAKEKIDDWGDKDHHFSDLKMSICTGDYRLTPGRKSELEKADIILLTSEMLASRTRNYRAEQNDWIKDVGTLIVDECVSPDCLIETNIGLIPIGRIIDENLDVKVLSFNHSTQKCEYKEILARSKKVLKRRWYSLSYDGGNLSVTGDHLVYCEGRGYVAAKTIKIGDVLYVRVNKRGKTGNFRNIVGGRKCIKTSTWEISKIENSTRNKTKTIRRVEIQKIEEIGWNPAKSCSKFGLRRLSLPVQHAKLPKYSRNLQFVLPEWREKSNKKLVEADQQSVGFGCMVYGRWLTGCKSNGHAYGGFFKNRSRIIGGLVEKIVENQTVTILHKKILAIDISSRRKRQVSKSCPKFYNSKNELQINPCSRGNVLSNVWHQVQTGTENYFFVQTSDSLWQCQMSEKVSCNDDQNRCLEAEESYCCDLEIEDNNNFFADGVLVHNCHLLGVTGRGDDLEVGLMQFCDLAPKARLVFLSATMPNVKEIADWVAKLTGRDTYLINSKYRPCDLGIHWETYDDSNWSYEAKEEAKIASAVEIIQDHPEDVFLAFVHTKNTGKNLLRVLKQLDINSEFHSADLDKETRQDTEEKFRNRKLRCLVATSTLAWGCNLPARRVVILGVHRGLQEVENYDIFQMIGRSGRPGYDPRGDAYILLPEKQKNEYMAKLKKPTPIESRLLEHIGDEKNPHYKTLAFHLVSEIYLGGIQAPEDVCLWYRRSLAAFQAKDLDDSIIKKTLEDLCKCGALFVDENGVYQATTVGRVASMFYYSPFDVADLKRNFRFVFENNMQESDVAVSVALGAVDTNKMGFVSKAEANEMGSYQQKVEKLFGGAFNQPAIKGGYAYYVLLNGLSTEAFMAISRGFQFDYERTSSVLQMLDSLGAKWNKKDFFKQIESRISYGVRAELVPLCRVKGVGAKYAERFWAAGLKTAQDLANNPDHVKSIVRKNKTADEIVTSAKAIVLTD